MTATMKAVFYSRYGSADVLTLSDLPKPTPTDDQVLVKVHASSVNPLDWHIMRADPFLVRFENGFFKPKRPINIPGADLAGVVEAVGPKVTQFKVGDAVYGGRDGGGGFAEYACLSQRALVHQPQGLSFEQTASVPVAALTALQALRRGGEILSGQRVLINGASGGVGTFAVQIAKALGAAHVTGVCSTANVELVRSIGADAVVDYKREAVADIGQRFDLILDNVGNLSLGVLKRLLTDSGISVGVGFTSVRALISGVLFKSLVLKRGQQHAPLLANITADDLHALNTMMTDGRVTPVIDRTYPLSAAADAIRYLETGRARGKVVVCIAP